MNLALHVLFLLRVPPRRAPPVHHTAHGCRFLCDPPPTCVDSHSGSEFQSVDSPERLLNLGSPSVQGKRTTETNYSPAPPRVELLSRQGSWVSLGILALEVVAWLRTTFHFLAQAQGWHLNSGSPLIRVGKHRRWLQSSTLNEVTH